MRHTLVASACALALLTACTSPQDQQAKIALASAEAVASDLAALQAEVQTPGSAITPAETGALSKAVADAQAGIAALSGGQSSAASVLGTIEADLVALEPFIPAIAAVVGTLAAPALTSGAPNYPAVAKLAADMQSLRNAA